MAAREKAARQRCFARADYKWYQSMDIFHAMGKGKKGATRMLLILFLILSAGAGLWTGLTLGGWAGLAAALAAAIGCFLALTTLLAVVLGVSVLWAGPNRQRRQPSRYYWQLMRQCAAVGFFLLRIHFVVQGREKLPENGTFLLVCNHQSVFDPVLLARAMPRGIRLRFVSKKENDRLPVVGRFLRQLDCLSLDREDDRQALRVVLRAAKLLKEQDWSLAVFPEGRISPTGQLLPFRNGAFQMARRAGRPIVVAALQGSGQIRGNLFRRASRVRLQILDVISAGQVQLLSTAQIGQRIRETMEKGLVQD